MNECSETRYREENIDERNIIYLLEDEFRALRVRAAEYYSSLTVKPLGRQIRRRGSRYSSSVAPHRQYLPNPLSGGPRMSARNLIRPSLSHGPVSLPRVPHMVLNSGLRSLAAGLKKQLITG